MARERAVSIAQLGPKPKDNAYTVMLVIALTAMIGSCLLLWYDIRGYGPDLKPTYKQMKMDVSEPAQQQPQAPPQPAPVQPGAQPMPPTGQPPAGQPAPPANPPPKDMR